jgi:hypothetical protein
MAKNKETSNELIQVGSSAIYQEFRNILVEGKKRFDMPEFEEWPTAIIDNKSVKGTMNVRPDPKVVGQYLNPDELAIWQKRMQTHIMGMNDLTADVFDIVTYRWLQTAKHPEAMVTITADELLKMRGLQPQKSGQYRGGFKKEKKELITQHIHILSNTWIYIDEIELPVIEDGKRQLKKFNPRSPAIVISSILDEVDENGKKHPYAWRVRPGDVFAPFFLDKAARQTAWMSQMALKFDPQREKWEKRLTRYFAFQWRVRHNSGNFLAPIKVKTLLDNAIQGDVDPRNPLRTKERLEKSLNNLRQNNVIKDWVYIDENEKIVGQKGWWHNEEGCWQQWKIEVTPPVELLEAYAQLSTQIKHATKAVSKAIKSMTSISPALDHMTKNTNAINQSLIGIRIKKVRDQYNLTLEQASQKIREVTGHVINVSTISRIEKCESTPRKKTQEIIEQWLKRYDV